MLAKAEAKYIRMASRKVRLVLDLIKGKSVEHAVFILENVNKRAADPVKRVVNSAFANLNHNRQDKFLAKDVIISDIRADEGPYLMRYRAATMGRATPVKHRTSMIKVELDKISGDVKNKKAEALSEKKNVSGNAVADKKTAAKPSKKSGKK